MSSQVKPSSAGPPIAGDLARRKVDRAELRAVLDRRRRAGLALRHARRLRLLAEREADR